MQKSNIIYWTTTVLFSAFMLFSAIPNIIVDAESVKFLSHLGYPEYIIPFLGIAKSLGIIALFVPGYPRITEWAYAGLFFDLLGAVYSVIAVDGFQPGMLVMVLPFGFLFISYVLYHKRLRQRNP